jgi:anhydro-N-acetylmuramic acid kinase
MLVAGVMSGTSADGVDVALCRIAPATSGSPRVRVLLHQGFAYPRALRAKILALAGGEAATAAQFSQLNWRLGRFYAACVQQTAEAAQFTPQLVSMHGQTIDHQPHATQSLGERTRSTWQIGEAAVVAEELRLPVISDLRAADLAAGGQAAPLVPMLDWCLFRHPSRHRLLLNLGGIANITAIPAGGTIDDVLAFDTGPANMVIDALMERLYQRRYDRNGAVARRGKVMPPLLDSLLRDRYFAAAPPKTCGREQFGTSYVDRLLQRAHLLSAKPEDIITTATSLTATTVARACAAHCLPWMQRHAPRATTTQMIVAGGGANNATLMSMLQHQLDVDGIKAATTESNGIDVAAKEAAAFALLGWLTWHGLPGNVPSATGARRAVVLGKVSDAH